MFDHINYAEKGMLDLISILRELENPLHNTQLGSDWFIYLKIVNVYCLPHV